MRFKLKITLYMTCVKINKKILKDKITEVRVKHWGFVIDWMEGGGRH